MNERAVPLGEPTGASVHIQNLEKRFGDVLAVRDFSIDIEPGEFISVLGASGSGKTTILRMIAGLEEATSGRILVGGKETTELPPEARNIGLVFQDYALFPHMTVEENISFPLRMRNFGKAHIKQEVQRILALVGTEHLGNRRPSQLSGGQQQRVALARALVFKPKLLLLDEPLSALDKNLREHMKAEIKALHRRTGVTIIYVTHDQSEALAMSDRIVVMRDGRKLDVGAPGRLYSLPTSTYLANFLGDANLIDGRLSKKKETSFEVDCEFGTFEFPGKQLRFENDRIDEAVKIVLRPENVTVNPPIGAEGLTLVDCKVDEMLYSGSHTIYRLKTLNGSSTIIAHCGEHPMGSFAPGSQVKAGLKFKPSAVVRAQEEGEA